MTPRAFVDSAQALPDPTMLPHWPHRDRAARLRYLAKMCRAVNPDRAAELDREAAKSEAIVAVEAQRGAEAAAWAYGMRAEIHL